MPSAGRGRGAIRQRLGHPLRFTPSSRWAKHHVELGSLRTPPSIPPYNEYRGEAEAAECTAPSRSHDFGTYAARDNTPGLNPPMVTRHHAQVAFGSRRSTLTPALHWRASELKDRPRAELASRLGSGVPLGGAVLATVIDETVPGRGVRSSPRNLRSAGLTPPLGRQLPLVCLGVGGWKRPIAE